MLLVSESQEDLWFVHHEKMNLVAARVQGETCTTGFGRRGGGTERENTGTLAATSMREIGSRTNRMVTAPMYVLLNVSRSRDRPA